MTGPRLSLDSNSVTYRRDQAGVMTGLGLVWTPIVSHIGGIKRAL